MGREKTERKGVVLSKFRVMLLIEQVVVCVCVLLGYIYFLFFSRIVIVVIRYLYYVFFGNNVMQYVFCLLSKELFPYLLSTYKTKMMSPCLPDSLSCRPCVPG